MQDDGVCHHLHRPGRMLFDRAARGGPWRVSRAGRGVLWDVHQSKKPHNQFVTDAEDESMTFPPLPR